MSFTSSLVLWLIWCLSYNVRPLNILSGIVGRITLLVFIISVFSMQVPAYAIRSTGRVKKCRNTDAIHSKKHLYYPHSCCSQVCAWTMGSRSGLRSTLDSWGTSLNKTHTWYQHHTLNFTVCCRCNLLQLLSLKDTAAGLQEGYVWSENKRQSCSYISLSWSIRTKTVQNWVCTTSCGKTAVLNPKSELQFCSRSPHSNARET